MDPRSQNQKTLQLVKMHVQKYAVKIKKVIGDDEQITYILSVLYKRFDDFAQNNHSYEEWVGAWRDIEQLKEAVSRKIPFTIDEENLSRQKRYHQAFNAAATSHAQGKSTHIPDPGEEHYRLLSEEEYQELFPERIKYREKMKALIHSDEHRALSLAQLSINAFVNENYPSVFFLKKIAQTLNNIQIKHDEEKEKEKLWQAILQVYQQKKDEQLKIVEMKQTIINYYFAIRKSPTGSEGFFFGKGSKFGDELEKFIKREIGMNVPHRVNTEESPLQINIYLEKIR